MIWWREACQHPQEEHRGRGISLCRDCNRSHSLCHGKWQDLCVPRAEPGYQQEQRSGQMMSTFEGHGENLSSGETAEVSELNYFRPIKL